MRRTETCTSAAGPVTVARTLYCSGKEKAVSPLELWTGIVEGHGTPLTGRQAMWIVSHLTPGEGEALFAELTLVKLADGAKDNWSFLDQELPAAVAIFDFYQAVDHFRVAFDAAYGENTPKAMSQCGKYRHILRDDEQALLSLCTDV